MAVWPRATSKYHVNGTDMVSWSVARSLDARGPVDHASVGLAQACPNKPLPVSDHITQAVACS